MSLEIEVTEQDQKLLEQLDKDEAILDQQLAAQGAAAPSVDKSEPEELADKGQESKTDKPAEQAAAAATDGKKKEASAPENNKPGTQSATDKPGEKKPEEKKDETKPGEQAKEGTRYQKEIARREKSWEKLNEEKTTFQKEREKFEQERQAFERQKLEQKEPEYTPEQYEKAAEDFEKDGKLDLAESARAMAKQLREQPADAREAQQFKQAQVASWRKVLEKHPELNVAGSETQKRFKALVDSDPIFADLFGTSPRAYELVGRMLSNHAELESSKTQAARVPDLEKQVKELTAEVEKLRIATAPSGGGSGSMPAEKTFEQLSPVEQEAEMRRMGEQADRL